MPEGRSHTQIYEVEESQHGLLDQTLLEVAEDEASPLGSACRILKQANMLEESGSVFTSSEATLRPGFFYFIGLNPGGEASDESGEGKLPSIGKSLALSRLGCNGFDQDWSRPTARFPAGHAPMQLAFKDICLRLGMNYAEVCATNFVFTRSARVASHPEFERDRLAHADVHRLFLDVVQPEFVWLMGDPSTVGLDTDQMSWEPSGYGNWSIGRGTIELFGRSYRACHTPHLTFWSAQRYRDAFDWAFKDVKRALVYPPPHSPKPTRAVS